MALLEEPNVCSICEHPVSGHTGIVPVYFCPRCFETYKVDILERAPWVMLLLSFEKARRKRRNRLIKHSGLPVTVNVYQGIVL
jgi:hypothetical protein